MLVELLYCSASAVPKLANADLDQRLASARWRNLAQDITGMMIYYRGEFVQILEGSKKSVQNVFEKFICPDPRHTAIIKYLKIRYHIAVLTNGRWVFWVLQKSNHICHYRQWGFWWICSRRKPRQSRFHWVSMRLFLSTNRCASPRTGSFDNNWPNRCHTWCG